jgi:hypothetical protein
MSTGNTEKIAEVSQSGLGQSLDGWELVRTSETNAQGPRTGSGRKGRGAAVRWTGAGDGGGGARDASRRPTAASECWRWM